MLFLIYLSMKQKQIGTAEFVITYCKRGNFRVGVICAFFRDFVLIAKITPRENKTNMPL